MIKLTPRQKLNKICALLREAFAKADANGLYVGMGKSSHLPDTREAQQGRIITELRKLVES